MTKSELIQNIADKKKLSLTQAEIIVNILFDSITDSLIEGDRIEIRGFGSFEIRNYKGYVGRNPSTGESVQVKPKKLPFFKVGKALKEKVDGDNP